MALPASPPISLSQVCTEFGAPATTPLASFLRGGAYVPNAAPNLGVPTALPISLLDLLGAAAGGGGAVVALTSRTVYAAISGAGTVNAGVRFYAAGALPNAQEERTPGGITTIAGEWRISGVGSDYDIRASVVSVTGVGSNIGDIRGSWLNLGTDRLFTAQKSAALGIREEILTVEIRDATTLAVLVTATYTLQAERA